MGLKLRNIQCILTPFCMYEKLQWCSGVRKAAMKNQILVAQMESFEFNSDFLMTNSLIKVLFKFSHAAFAVTNPIQIEETVPVFKYQVHTFTKIGDSLRLAAIHEVCQAITHYTNLRSYMQEKISGKCVAYRKLPSATIGFFPFEPGLACGLSGIRLPQILHYLQYEDVTRVE